MMQLEVDRGTPSGLKADTNAKRSAKKRRSGTRSRYIYRVDYIQACEFLHKLALRTNKTPAAFPVELSCDDYLVYKTSKQIHDLFTMPSHVHINPAMA